MSSIATMRLSMGAARWMNQASRGMATQSESSGSVALYPQQLRQLDLAANCTTELLDWTGQPAGLPWTAAACTRNTCTRKHTLVAHATSLNLSVQAHR
eukprot:1148495-Pelagomonas_calceolata.AAC.3